MVILTIGRSNWYISLRFFFPTKANSWASSFILERMRDEVLASFLEICEFFSFHSSQERPGWPSIWVAPFDVLLDEVIAIHNISQFGGWPTLMGGCLVGTRLRRLPRFFWKNGSAWEGGPPFRALFGIEPSGLGLAIVWFATYWPSKLDFVLSTRRRTYISGCPGVLY